ncbi:AAA family ATPase [Kutzneria buriramensis]|uniref:NadR type nicotinamide-nucleotide adenylyltransferase n=1 Tax=Kutzneria buriramensis TaxID=1045776 RepID=A0A3E0HYU4_9PSEU|nr:AAA family ATPase [Kutzneria buriramensis]REH51642.1 NadR type nicotinamide-nucleotide adenylyltransferase [Kutzneria buriramensis]
MTYEHGLVLGKFYPPHAGHHHLIRTASRHCRRLTVLVEAASVESIPLADRVAWLRAVHPDVDVVGTRCDVPVDMADEPIWAAQVAVMRAALGDTLIDAVFTSEKYGDELARRFGAEHVAVDPTRLTFPVSATAIRADLAGQWDSLDPVVRSGLATRLVFVGAESTGTTTVSRLVAEAFRDRGGVWARTRWVQEYGRDYTYVKWRAEGGELDELVWNQGDFDKIASEQRRLEDEAAAAGSPLLVCDTDAFATAIWERRYIGSWRPRTGVGDFYLLTDHQGVPWLDDGLREGDLGVRAEMTAWFTAALHDSGYAWALLTGSLKQRVELAMKIADQTLRRRSTFADPLG